MASSEPEEPRDRRLKRPAWSHPAFLLGAIAAAIAVAALPAQYTPVLWRHDRAFIALGTTPLVIGGVIAAYSRRPAAVTSTVLGAFALFAGGTVGYKLYGGIGWPDPQDVLMSAAMAGTAVAVMAHSAGQAARFVRLALAVVLSTTSLMGFAMVAARPGEPDGRAGDCETRRGVEFCAYPRFAPLIDRWERPVSGVLERLPRGVRVGAPPVVQATREARRDAMATPFLDWDRPETGVAELALALDVAAWSVGINEEFRGRRGVGGAMCNPGVDEGRNIVAFWLAGQSTPEAANVLRRLESFGDAISGSTYAAPIVPPSGAEQAVALLERDPDEVGALVREHWGSITTGEASGAEVGRLLGLPAEALRSADPDQSDPRFHTQDCR